ELPAGINWYCLIAPHPAGYPQGIPLPYTQQGTRKGYPYHTRVPLAGTLLGTLDRSQQYLMEESPHEYNRAKPSGLSDWCEKYPDLLFHFFPACASDWVSAGADEKFTIHLAEHTLQNFY